MKRLKLFIALALLMFTLPTWRFIDMVAWVDINKTYLVVLLFAWSTSFLIIPISLVYKRFFIPGTVLNLCFTILAQFFLPEFSSHTQDQPEARHCSLLHYSGFFYSIKSILPSAHEDDLMIRNQICWMRKLEKSVPDQLTKHEVNIYRSLIEEKLFLPEVKWKTSLPFLIPIYLHFSDLGLEYLEAQKFWNNHYTAEVRNRDYNFLSYPHSSYIKWEYGLVEKYWAGFLDNVEITREEKGP